MLKQLVGNSVKILGEIRSIRQMVLLGVCIVYNIFGFEMGRHREHILYMVELRC